MCLQHNHDNPVSNMQFRMPQSMLYGTLNPAHGGVTETVPSRYGQGEQASTDYEKYWYDNVSPSQSQISTYDSTNSPHEKEESSMSSAPHVRRMDLDEDSRPDYEPGFLKERSEVLCSVLSFPQDVAPFPFTHDSDLDMSNFFPLQNLRNPNNPLPPLPLSGLPLYSASGFDMLKVLSKVATRPNPKVMLGPVDMTCSFVVVDARRFDAPIVYASPTFSKLTGYSEAEVLGRNCRFLQAPSGQIERGDERLYTTPNAVRHLRKCLLQEKECQASLVNYRKDGRAFVNFVTVIPVAIGDDFHEITHLVGFQVDLSKQSNSILQKLRNGSYIDGSSSSITTEASAGTFGVGRARKARGVSREMVDLLRAHRPWIYPGDPGIKLTHDHEKAELHTMLLENTDDFIHVISPRGSLLYVAPSVRRLLGYEATELVGRSLADLCHPADTIPLLRDLKEATSTPAPVNSSPTTTDGGPSSLFTLSAQPLQSAGQTSVNLLFRARHKNGEYIWLELRGRIHGDQGKGRKSVILIGRRTDVPSIRRGAVMHNNSSPDFWGLIAPNGLVLSASGAGSERLGYGADGMELVGRSLGSLVQAEESRRVGDLLASTAYASRDETRRMQCKMLMRRLEGQPVRTVCVEVVFYSHERENDTGHDPPLPRSLPPSLVFQIRFLDRAYESPTTNDPNSMWISSTTAKCRVGKTSYRGTALSSHSSEPQRHIENHAHARLPPEKNMLEELDTTREASWQYELTRLRFENQRMREEVARLEHLKNMQDHMLYPKQPCMGKEAVGNSRIPRDVVSPPQVLSSPGLPTQPLLHLEVKDNTLSFNIPQKRFQDGGPKLVNST